MLTIDDKQAMLHQLASLLQDNLGNRITHTLINGVCTTLDAMTPVAPSPDVPESVDKASP